MAVSYEKLWKLLKEMNMVKTDLRTKAGVTSNALVKMGRGGDVSTNVLSKICLCLGCDIGDIVEVVSHEKEKN